jgi:thiol:disulfide interchange protein DsbD
MMHKLLLAFFVLIAFTATAQVQNPVTWSYTAVKKGEGTYQLVITATITKSWHIYSQNSGKGPIPTKLTFKANPLVKIDGDVKEEGSIIKKYDENFKSNVLYYSEKVKFIQTVKVKAGVKTNISGTVEYMVCNDEMCLPPTKKTFDIKLQ